MQNPHSLEVLQNPHSCVRESLLVGLELNNLLANKMGLCDSDILSAHSKLLHCPHAVHRQLQALRPSVGRGSDFPIDDRRSVFARCSKIYLSGNRSRKAPERKLALNLASRRSTQHPKVGKRGRLEKLLQRIE